MSEGVFYVAHASDDRVRPVVAPSPEECVQRAAEAMDLRHGAADLSNWTPQWKGRDGFNATPVINDERSWRLDVRAQWYGYVSMHEVSRPVDTR